MKIHRQRQECDQMVPFEKGAVTSLPISGLFSRRIDLRKTRCRGWKTGCERHLPALKALRACNQHAEATLERIGTHVPAISDHGSLDALAAVAGDALDVEDSERHCDNCTDHGGAGHLKAVNDELSWRGHQARLEEGSGYF